MRPVRWLPALLFTPLLSIGLIAPAADARVTAPATSCDPGTSYSDFNGDGCADLAIGVHGENIGDLAEAGAVNLLFGNPTEGLVTSGNVFVTQNTPGVTDSAQAQDYFGRSREAGDFDGDGLADLAVGAYGETKEGNPTVLKTGAVHVFYGLGANGQDFWTEDTPGVPGTADDLDYFGRALAAGYFNDDAYQDLAIGMDGKDIGTATDAGAVVVLYGSNTGLITTGAQLWAQGHTGLHETSELGDKFGIALAAGDLDGDGFDDLAIGATGEGDGVMADVGAVSVLFGSSDAGLQSGDVGADDVVLMQDSVGPGTDEPEDGDGFGRDLTAGDFNADGIDDLAVGARDEDMEAVSASKAGAVTVIESDSGVGLAEGVFLTQSDLTGGDGPETGDDFGRGLEAGNFDSDPYDELAIGTPQEDVGGFCGIDGICDAGAVHILEGSDTGITTTGRYIIQDDVGEEAEGNEEKQFGDEFGKDFQVADFNGDGFEDLAISAWRETLNDGPGGLPQAGIVNVVYGSDSGLDLGSSQVWHQDVTGVQGDGAESYDQFGWFG